MPVELPRRAKRTDGLGHYEATMPPRTALLLIAQAAGQCPDPEVKRHARKALETLSERLITKGGRMAVEDYRNLGFDD